MPHGRMRIMKWIERLRSRTMPSKALVLYPDGVEERGFHGKNAFADQFNITGGKARIIFDIGANTGQTAERYWSCFTMRRFTASNRFNRLMTVFASGLRASPGSVVFGWRSPQGQASASFIRLRTASRIRCWSRVHASMTSSRLMRCEIPA